MLKKYNEIWHKIKSLSKREFDKKPLHNNKYISINIKIYNDTIHTEFKYKKILKDNKHCKYIPIEPKDGDSSILVNSNNKHHPQILLEKCLYSVNKKVLLGKYIDKS